MAQQVEKMKFTEHQLVEEIRRLTSENCWGCTSTDPMVQRYGSAHEMGCRMERNSAIRVFFKEALINLYFDLIADDEGNKTLTSDLHTRLMEEWTKVAGEQ